MTAGRRSRTMHLRSQICSRTRAWVLKFSWSKCARSIGESERSGQGLARLLWLTTRESPPMPRLSLEPAVGRRSSASTASDRFGSQARLADCRAELSRPIDWCSLVLYAMHEAREDSDAAGFVARVSDPYSPARCARAPFTHEAFSPFSWLRLKVQSLAHNFSSANARQ